MSDRIGKSTKRLFVFLEHKASCQSCFLYPDNRSSKRGIICVHVSRHASEHERDLDRKHKAKNLWERHGSAKRWDGESLTFPSTPTPQSASWIMLTSFPPSPKRKQKQPRCQDSHQWLTNSNSFWVLSVYISQDTPLVWPDNEMRSAAKVSFMTDLIGI